MVDQVDLPSRNQTWLAGKSVMNHWFSHENSLKLLEFQLPRLTTPEGWKNRPYFEVSPHLWTKPLLPTSWCWCLRQGGQETRVCEPDQPYQQDEKAGQQLGQLLGYRVTWHEGPRRILTDDRSKLRWVWWSVELLNGKNDWFNRDACVFFWGRGN